MGMMMIQPGADHPHTKSVACEWMGCKPVADEKPKAPEFTIETRYIKKGTVVMSPGWAYILKWNEPHPSRANEVLPRTRGGYAFATEAEAHAAAEEGATEIARSLLPVNTYKFTPEV